MSEDNTKLEKWTENVLKQKHNNNMSLYSSESLSLCHTWQSRWFSYLSSSL
uniref:Uncharacterized protein n=1 Tax=Arundo donax TaxID=35708 RepID=A0A0A9AV06_ARUDO